MKSTLLLLMLLVICSCRKQITIDLPDNANKPVLNLIMVKDSALVAHVTLAGYISSSFAATQVRNAVVRLYKNDLFQEIMKPLDYYGYQYFRSTIKAEEGATYRVAVDIDGYPQLEGSDFIPAPVALGEIKVTPVAVRDQIKANVSVELHDKNGEKNYYQIKIYSLRDFHDGLGYDLNHHYEFATGDPKDGLFGEKKRREFFTDDALFDGRSARFNFLVANYEPRDSTVVEVTTLTYSSYSYLLTAAMAREKNDDVLSEKVIVFNNILNGLGIVGGVTIQRYGVPR